MKAKSLILAFGLLLAGTSANALQKVKRVGGVEFYQIGTTAELVEFAELVNGTDPGACGELTADIDYTSQNTMIGTGGAYSGQFEGNGHRISVNMTAAASDFGLFFQTAAGSVIRNLVVTGRVTSGSKFACSFVAKHYGTLENCISFATIESTLSGDGTHGGLVARTWAGAVVKNCVFAGKMLGTATHSCGGVVGWAEGSTTITNCLVAPAEWTVGTTNGFAITRNPGNASIRNCFCNSTVTGNTSNATVLPDDAIASGKACFTMNGDQSVVNFYQTIGLDGAPYPFNMGHSQVFATGVSCGGADLGSAVYTNEAQEMTTHAAGPVCPVCGTLNVNYVKPVDGFYELATAEELNWYSMLVNAGNPTYNAKLTADIDMADVDFTPIGRGVIYRGTFDGQGHKISNLIINTPGTQYVGLIGVVGGGAVVKNVVLDSTCELYGDAFIGVVGGSNADGVVYIDRVGFEGKAQGANQNVSGIFGVDMSSTATPYITNCYIAGGSIKGGRESATLSGWCGGSSCAGYVKNCYSISSIEGCDADQPFCRNGGYENCYYYASQSQKAGFNGITPVATTPEQAASGELAYLLNKAAGETVFYQTLGEDKWPVLDPTHGKVYKHGDIFSNEILIQNADGKYMIGSPEELVAFSEFENSGNTGANAILTANIDMSEVANFTPIGLYSDFDGEARMTYSGTFDGQGYEISNLTVYCDNQKETGLFSRCQGATIKNLGIVNATIENTKGIRSGVLGGEIYQSQVINVYTVGKLSITTSHSQAGCVFGEAASTTVTNSYTLGSAMGDPTSAASGGTTFVNSYWGDEANAGAPTGELCYKLNGGDKYDNMAFAQTLGVNEYPVLRANCEDLVFANEGGFTNDQPYWYQLKVLIEKGEALAATTKGSVETGLLTSTSQISANCEWDNQGSLDNLLTDDNTYFHSIANTPSSPLHISAGNEYIQGDFNEAVNAIRIEYYGRNDGTPTQNWHDTPNKIKVCAINDLGEEVEITTQSFAIPNANNAYVKSDVIQLGADYSAVRMYILGTSSNNDYWNVRWFQIYKVEDDPAAAYNAIPGMNTAVTLMEKQADAKAPVVADRTATKQDVEDMKAYYDAVMALLAGTYNPADFATARPIYSTPDEPVFFYVRNVRRNGQYANFTATNDYQTQIAADATPDLANMYYFVADGPADANGYVPVKIFNALSGGANFNDFNDWTYAGRSWYLFSNPNNDGKGVAICKVADINNDQCWNDNAGTTVKAWRAAGDAGSVWTFEPVMLENYPETAVFTYNHQLDGKTVRVEKDLAIVGKPAPAPAGVPAYVSVEGIPNEIVSGDATYTLTATVNTPFEASNVDVPIWYNLKMREDDPGYGEYMLADFGQKQISLTNNIEKDPCAYLWAFVGNPYDGYQMLNFAAGKGKYLGVEDKACMGDDADFRWTIGYRNAQNFGFSDGENWLNGNGGRNATWVGLYRVGPSGDVGSSMMPVLVEAPEPTFDFDPTPTSEDPEMIVGSLSEFHITIGDVYSVALAANAKATIENQFRPITDASVSLDGNVLTVKLEEPITTQEIAIFTLSLKGLVINGIPYNQLVNAVYYVTGDPADGEHSKADAINSIMAEGAVDIYGLNGTLVKKAATAEDLNALKGIYVIKGKKFMLK